MSMPKALCLGAALCALVWLGWNKPWPQVPICIADDGYSIPAPVFEGKANVAAVKYLAMPVVNEGKSP